MIYRHMDVDPTELEPGDIVLGTRDFEEDGCHCDVVINIKRPVSDDQ
jgi:hypothetical protein